MIKVVAFDLFGTVFDLSDTPREEIRAYLDHIKQPWSPLRLPSSWENLKAFPDSKEGIERLRQNYMVVTMSNAPLGLTAKLCKNNDIQFDAIIPLEMNKVFKPSPEAYLSICEIFNVLPEEVLMVTANPVLGDFGYGDVDMAHKLGMHGVLIRQEPFQKNLSYDIVILATSIEFLGEEVFMKDIT